MMLLGKQHNMRQDSQSKRKEADTGKTAEEIEITQIYIGHDAVVAYGHGI